MPSINGKDPYVPTLWALNKWVNLVLFLAWQVYYKKKQFPTKKEMVDLSDCGLISIEWSADD